MPRRQPLPHEVRRGIAIAGIAFDVLDYERADRHRGKKSDPQHALTHGQHELNGELIGDLVARGTRFESLTTFDDVIERTGLGGATPIANRGQPVDVEALGRLLPAAVEEARRHIVERRNRFEDVINAKLDEELKALEQLRARRFAQLELTLEQSAQPAAHTAHREERARRDVEEVFDDYLEWIQETMTTERTPWLKVICAMAGNATEAVANSAALTTSGGAASDNA